MSTVTLTTTIDSTELWSRIWGSDPEAFGPWWHNIGYINGDWQHEGTAYVELSNPDDEELTIEKYITVDDIVKALNDPLFPSHLRQNILDDNTDCVDSDAVVQFIVYGDVVFG